MTRLGRYAAILILLTGARAAAQVEVVAGGGTQAEGAATGIRLIEPFGVAFDREGNWYICEHKGQKIMRVDRGGTARRFAGTGVPGRSGDGGPADQAALSDPHGLVIAPDGAIYVADTVNHQVRRIDPKTRRIDTIAGTGEAGFSGDGGPAKAAQFNGAFAIALNRAGDRLYVADLGNRRVRLINLRSGNVETVAGDGSKGVPDDGAPARRSPLVDPRAVTVDSKGLLYILERGGNALRVVDSEGRIRTLIGPDTVQPPLKGPKHLCVDAQDRVVIADAENHLIRRYDPNTKTTPLIAGTGTKGAHIDKTNPLATELNRPHGVTIHPNGDLFVSDSDNHRVLRIRAGE
jgi:DNA-binding beta-propeller fold protein YncE